MTVCEGSWGGGGVRERTGEGSTAEGNLEITTVINHREGARPEEGVGGGGGGGGVKGGGRCIGYTDIYMIIYQLLVCQTIEDRCYS